MALLARFLFAVTALFFAESVHAALVAGQIDNFQDGTTKNWANGGAGAPLLVNVSTGGPAGANDRFLEVTADGSGAGARLTTFNRSQWLGDYIGQGVTAIDMDLENLGSVSLSIRLAFKSSTVNGASGYLSSAVMLLPGSGWQHVEFAITPASITALGGPAAFNTFFANGIAEARIINESGATNTNGDIVVGQLGIDNIQAVPEPSTIALLAAAALLSTILLFRRRT